MSHTVTRSLIRLRWAVRGTLTLGVAASVVANVLHAQPTVIGRSIAAWPPLALLLTVELVSRIPVGSRWLSVVRILATAAIASIAAYISYWHMAATAARYGESGVSAYLLPLTVDGLIVVASVSLVELAGRIRAAEVARALPAPAPTAPVLPTPVVPQVPVQAGPVLAPVMLPTRIRSTGPAPRRDATSPLTGQPLAAINGSTSN